jgi:flagellar export protein FliJ
MPRFRFPLDPLLDLRRREEERCRSVVAGIEQERVALETQLAERQRDIAAGQDALRGGLVGRIDALQLRQQAVSIIGVDQLARRTVLELAGVHQRLAAARAVLVEASRRRRAIEILREQRLAAWNEELARKETALFDDLANAARTRQMRSSDGADSAVGAQEGRPA